MSDAATPRRPLIPPRTPRRERKPTRMADQPGRDPRQPYIDHRANVGSLAKHLRIGLDPDKPQTVVSTQELALILDYVIGLAFPTEGQNQYQTELAGAYAGLAAAQEKRALEGEADENG